LSERLRRRTKILYGCGDTGFSLTSTIIGAYFAIFLTDVVGISAAVAAAAIFIGRSWDYVNDPLIGHLSDRTRTRWGRRRPFLLLGPLPYALAFALLWWRPPLESELALAVYYALAYVLYDASATVVYMPYYALAPELTIDYDERTSLATYQMFFSILASLIAFIVPLAIIGGFEPQSGPRVLLMGAIFGILSGLPLLLTFLGTRERRDYMALAQPSLVQSLRAAAGNRPFVFGLAIYLCTWVAVDIIQATLIYFIKWGVEREAQNDIIMGTIFIVAMVALPLWRWTAERWDKRRAYILGISLFALFQIILITLTPASTLGLLLALSALAGVGVSAAHVLPWAIIPDAIEWDEWHTGERHEGMFYSLTTLIRKVASSIAVPLALLILDATGYVPNTTVQSPRALMGIRILIGPVPAVLLCLGIVFALQYPLSRERYLAIRRDLEQRHASQP
jgi:GPH family glycoside/pentoside/hexuronide:cation symporter